MLKSDRFLKVLLTLLVIGVWSLLLTNGFSAYQSQAQPQRQYGVWVGNTDGTASINGKGSLPVSTVGLVKVLAETPRQGWRLHSVVFVMDGYMVIVER